MRYTVSVHCSNQCGTKKCFLAFCPSDHREHGNTGACCMIPYLGYFYVTLCTQHKQRTNDFLGKALNADRDFNICIYINKSTWIVIRRKIARWIENFTRYRFYMDYLGGNYLLLNDLISYPCKVLVLYAWQFSYKPFFYDPSPQFFK